MCENGAMYSVAGNNRWISAFWRSFPLFGKEQSSCLDVWSGNCLLQISAVPLNGGKPCNSHCCGLFQLPLPGAGTGMVFSMVLTFPSAVLDLSSFREEGSRALAPSAQWPLVSLQAQTKGGGEKKLWLPLKEFSS